MLYTERIRALREDNDYNQTFVANAIHVAQTTYSDYENGNDPAITKNLYNTLKEELSNIRKNVGDLK